MPVNCPGCGAAAQPDAPSCSDCGQTFSPTSSMLTLQFPAEHPVHDVLPLDVLPPAPAPMLMPSAPVPAQPAPVAPPQQAQPQTLQPRTAAIVGVIVAVVAVVVTISLVATVHNGQTGSPTASPGGTDSPIAKSSVSSPPPTESSSPQQLLENEVAKDHAQVEALTGYWVPQLSSKRVGLVVSGITYDYQAIWSDFVNLRTRYPGALLLWSGDYSGFRYPDFWVTIIPQSYGDGDSANSWCDNAGIYKDNCFAKLITHTAGYADSTLLRN